MNEKIIEYLLANGGKRWIKYNLDRIYFDFDLVEETVMKKGLTTPVGFEIITYDNPFYDVNNDKFYGLTYTSKAFRECIEYNDKIDTNENGLLEDLIDD